MTHDASKCAAIVKRGVIRQCEHPTTGGKRCARCDRKLCRTHGYQKYPFHDCPPKENEQP